MRIHSFICSSNVLWSAANVLLFCRYFDAVQAKEQRRQQRLRVHTSYDVENGEFLCPLCECLSNTVIPLLPPPRVLFNRSVCFISVLNKCEKQNPRSPKLPFKMFFTFCFNNLKWLPAFFGLRTLLSYCAVWNLECKRTVEGRTCREGTECREIRGQQRKSLLRNRRTWNACERLIRCIACS